MAADLSGPAPGRDTAATLTIDLDALARNWRLLRDRATPGECGAVLKADAYGIGLEPAGRALWRAGCRTVFVAHLGEAERLRAALPEATIYVLNGFAPGTAPRYRTAGLRPILGSWPEIEDWASSAGDDAPPAAIHVDTGMNRLGLSVGEALALSGSPLLAAIRPALLMSHFVAAEEPGHPTTRRQIDAFAQVRTALPGLPASLSNSSGLFLAGRPDEALARPGYALYGGNPTPGRPNPMNAVVRLAAPVIQVRTVEAGETAGYNARWTAPGPRRLATLSVGYADGFLRSAGGTDLTLANGVETGIVLAGDHPCPIVGRISMDLTIVDVTDAPPVKRGDRLTLVGGALDVDEVGRRAGTIGYEILTDLGRRYARVHVGDGA